MSEWLASTLSRAQSVNDWLSPQRQSSLALLRETPWPSRKVEDWRYTSVAALDNTPFVNCDAGATSVDAKIEGLDSIDLVFVDGQLQTDIQALQLPQGLSIASFDNASADSQEPAAAIFASVKPERHVFGLVNDVLALQGLIIETVEGVVIQQPVRIIHRFSSGHEAHTRILVKVASGAKLTVVEEFVGDALSFNTGFAEYEVADSAHIEHYRFALQSGASLSAGGSHFKLATKAQLNSTLVAFGSDLSRLDVDVTHAGEHTQAKLNAIYLLDGNEHFDLHSTIEHTVPHGTTEENVRGIVADKSRAIFNGRIHIHRDAQKTLAELNNRNLLLSRLAEINTKPELEIYADDVRCAHGATIAEIDKSSLYYLQSRGIDKKQAQVMLNFGFINELVDQMPNQVLANWLRPQLRERFAAMDVQ